MTLTLWVWPPTSLLLPPAQQAVTSSLTLQTKLALQTPGPHPLSRNTGHLPATPWATAPTQASRGPPSKTELEDGVSKERGDS